MTKDRKLLEALRELTEGTNRQNDLLIELAGVMRVLRAGCDRLKDEIAATKAKGRDEPAVSAPRKRGKTSRR